MYVAHAHLASGDAVAGEALEVLNRVVIEVLEHADRFDPTRQPSAWLLGIAANIIKREQDERAKRARREPSIGVICSNRTDATGEIVSEDEMFDRLAVLAKVGPEHDLCANEEARALLALVSREDDRQVLRLAVLHDLDGTALGKALGISSGAARVRLHRAINRLRDAYHRRLTSNRGEADG
jgi:RNA polymerase sigma-70 factor (ECF subfamily)